MKFAAIAFAALSLAACAPAEEDPGTDLVGDATAGEVVWTAQGCLGCHGADGRGGSAGKDLVTAAANAAEFSTTVLEGDGLMPSFPDLSDQDVADLRAYVQTL